MNLASDPLLGLPLLPLWYSVIFFTLAMFLVFDGFDFGIGALFPFAEDEEERESMLAVVGPIWDVNQVWLIVFGGALFAVFPTLYAELFSRYYLLMFAVLLSLILRGASIEYYEQSDDPRWKRNWGRALVAGSIGAPFFIGVFAGDWLTGSPTILSIPGIVVGLALVALTAAEGASFLGKRKGELNPEVERYGLLADLAYLGLTLLAVAYLYLFLPEFRPGLLSLPVMLLVLITVALVAAHRRWFREGEYGRAVYAGAGQVFALVSIVALLLNPVIDPLTGTTVSEAGVPTLQLNMMTVVAAIFVPLVLLYFYVLYRSFSGPPGTGEGY